jgi:hypothetical protein
VKILVFAPHAALWQLAFPEALIAESLSKDGHEITYVSCGEAFGRFCVPMSAAGLSPESPASKRSAVCKQCGRNDRSIRSDFQFVGPTLREILTERDLADVEDLLAPLTRTTAPGLVWDDIAIGKVALYQVLLRQKKFNLDFDESQWSEYLIDLRNTLYSAMATRRLLVSDKPDRVLVYNGLYSVNRVLALLAEKNGIPSYFMHAGSNLARRWQTVSIGRGESFSYMPALLEQWKRFADSPATGAELSASTDHFLELLRGRNIYVYSKGKSSSHFDTRRHFGLKEGQKLIVATMSSDDEESAGIMAGAQEPRKGLLFASQIEWIQAVLEYVQQRPDLFLVIRVHPRDFPNRRESRKSQHAYLLEATLTSLPANAAVNWPSEGVSLYDLIDQTDVFLNAWSSTGRDIPMLGVPVVIYSAKLPWYPAELNYLGETREAYFDAIKRALADGWSFETARRAYRWSAFELDKATVFIGDSYPALENPDRSVLERIVGRVRRAVDPDHGKRSDLRRRRKRLGAAQQINSLLKSVDATIVDRMQPAPSEASLLTAETNALRGELKRLAIALFPDPSSRPASRLYQALCGCGQ